MIGYEFECFSFLFIVMLFSAGNVKKNVFTVFIVPIATIDGFFGVLFAVHNSVSIHPQPIFFPNLAS